MNLVEYDDEKLAQDSSIIQEILKDIQKDVENIFVEDNRENNISSIRDIMNKQDAIMNDLEEQYDRLMEICRELGFITSCIEKTRQKYRRCEDKISDMLDNVRLVENI